MAPSTWAINPTRPLCYARRVSELSTEVLVVGGGVIGVACAAALARLGHEVVLVERHARFGEETTSRNSGVIHAGLYYPTGSLKATLCVEGRALLYARCVAREISHRKTGKLVLAVTDEQNATLDAIAARARDNGAGDIRLMEGNTLRGLDPELFATLALYSPESGVVDVSALVEDLAHEARAFGAVTLMRTRVVGIEGDARPRVRLDTPDGLTEIAPRVVIDAAGLDADRIAALAGIDIDAVGLRIAPCKGEYFRLTADAPRPKHALVYPVPAGAGLGIHLTTDLGGQMHAGPDATFVRSPEYDVDETKRALFAERVRTYLPRLRDEHLEPAYAGVRPKLRGGEGLGRDFVIEDASAYGMPWLVLLVGIESPGITAALAIAERVAGIAIARLG
jgi:L-2-hydroxyglutarate oxidase LhgO